MVTKPYDEFSLVKRKRLLWLCEWCADSQWFVVSTGSQLEKNWLTFVRSFSIQMLPFVFFLNFMFFISIMPWSIVYISIKIFLPLFIIPLTVLIFLKYSFSINFSIIPFAVFVWITTVSAPTERAALDSKDVLLLHWGCLTLALQHVPKQTRSFTKVARVCIQENPLVCAPFPFRYQLFSKSQASVYNLICKLSCFQLITTTTTTTEASNSMKGPWHLSPSRAHQCQLEWEGAAVKRAEKPTTTVVSPKSQRPCRKCPKSALNSRRPGSGLKLSLSTHFTIRGSWLTIEGVCNMH